MSGSEDGQLRSPVDEQLSDDEHDTDSLDIKPPQVAYTRDSSGGGSSARRKVDKKSSKDKRHSKERRQYRQEQSGREHHERDIRDNGGGSGDRMCDRRSELERREHRRDDIEQRYHHRNNTNYDDNREMLLSKSNRRYQKYYDRNNEIVGSRSGSGGVTTSSGAGTHSNYHYQQQQQTQQSYHQQGQMHLSNQRTEVYYEQRQQSYNSVGSSRAIDYYGSRHNQIYDGNSKHSSIHDENYEMQQQQRERRKYHYEHDKDAESLEQDLRSRLISKRHKYVKSTDNDHDDDDDADGGQHYEVRIDRHDYDRMTITANERNYEERKVTALSSKSSDHHHHQHRQHHHEKTQRDNVIEVLDSPEVEQLKRNKHKRHNKEKDAVQVHEKRRITFDDPEQLARREKFLAAEREKGKRMEELEARREQRRERKEVMNVLSPTTVAASVTAGLNVKVMKRRRNDEQSLLKQKRSKHEEELSDDDNEACVKNDDDESASDDDDEDSDSDSSNSSRTSFQKLKIIEKKHSKIVSPMDSADEIELPESPLSIGELSKSPEKNDTEKKNSRPKHRSKGAVAKTSSRSPQSMSIRSNSRSISPSPSRSESQLSLSHSLTRSRSHSRSSRSDSRSISRSQSPHSDSAHSRKSSHSRSHSRSGDRIQTTDKVQTIDNVGEQLTSNVDSQLAKTEKFDSETKKTINIPQQNGSESPMSNEKSVPLLNYYPGVQGCRSVEEFQYLNRIAEGTYGIVYRAKDKRTNEIVALKRLKMEKEKEGFPITSLREINMLLKGQHPNIVTVREIVCSNKDMIFIVMDYVEHDLKSLMEIMKSRKQSFFPAEVKCLLHQLVQAIGHLHDNWILHRDLKTSNLLLSHKGILKVGDFGLAREYGSPLKHYTSMVVTLWYRAPELLLCTPEYSTPIDIWSVGCIFAEFLQMSPLFPGDSEIDEINRIFKELGTPNEKIWPGYQELPAVKNVFNRSSQFPEFPTSKLRKRFSDKTSDAGITLLQGLLTYDPKQRLTADVALKHSYFKELPPPIDPSMFPTWPAKSELGTRKTLASSPKPPSGGAQMKQFGRDDVIVATQSSTADAVSGTKKIVTGIITGNKKTAASTGFVLNAGVSDQQRQLAMGPGFSLRF